MDPGVILYLFQELNLSAGDVQTMLYKKSGLLGISGISNDMRDLLASDAPAAYGFDISGPARTAREAVQWLYTGDLAGVKDQNGAAMPRRLFRGTSGMTEAGHAPASVPRPFGGA